MYDPNDPVPRWSITTMGHIAGTPALAEAALRYADLGIPIFPCIPGGKQPLTANGFHDATSSVATVRHWWRRSPEANIGLPTGRRTGVVVVDVDLHHGESGYAAFERSRSAGIADGWGWLVRTPSGGLHAYYPSVPGMEQRCWQASSAHVDFRGDGGYVIAPPSRIEVNGAPRTYAVIAVANHAAQPVDATALLHFFEPPRPHRLPSERTAAGCGPNRLAAWVASRPEGGRNSGLFWAACEMVRRGHSDDEIASALAPAAQTAGLPDREIESTLRSAYRIACRIGGPPVSRPRPIGPSEAMSL